MSFLLDVPAIFVLGYLVESLGQAIATESRPPLVGSPRRIVLVFGVAIIFLFWLVSGLLYLEIVNFFGINGFDWMWKSGISSDQNMPKGAVADLVGLAIFASYPLWYFLGMRVAQRRQV